MTWIPVESTDVVAVGWEGDFVSTSEIEGTPLWPEFQKSPVPTGRGLMGIKFHSPPGATYLYFDVPAEFYYQFMSADSKGKFVNYVIKRSGLAYERVA